MDMPQPHLQVLTKMQPRQRRVVRRKRRQARRLTTQTPAAPSRQRSDMPVRRQRKLVQRKLVKGKLRKLKTANQETMPRLRLLTVLQIIQILGLRSVRGMWPKMVWELGLSSTIQMDSAPVDGIQIDEMVVG